MRTSKLFNPLTGWIKRQFENRVGTFHSKMLSRTVLILLVWGLGLISRPFLTWSMVFLWHIPFLLVLIREVIRYYWNGFRQDVRNAWAHAANRFRKVPLPPDHSDMRSWICANCGRPKMYDEMLASSKHDDQPDRPMCVKCPTRQPVKYLWRNPEGSEAGGEVSLPPGVSEALRQKETEEALSGNK